MTAGPAQGQAPMVCPATGTDLGQGVFGVFFLLADQKRMEEDGEGVCP